MCSRVCVYSFNSVYSVVGVTQAVHDAEKFLVVNHVESRAKVKVGSIEVLVEEGSVLNVVE